MATLDSRQLELLPERGGESVTYHRFWLAGEWVDYSIKRSARRGGTTITVGETGLRVGAPPRTSQRQVENLLTRHAPWIMRKLAEWMARRPPDLSWTPGTTIMVTGQPVRLSVNARCATVQRTDDELQVPVDCSDCVCLARVVTAWLRDFASTLFAERIGYFVPLLAVKTPSVRLSNARTRWGSCHPDGRVHLNWRLIQVPLALIDYVVVHELAHLHESNHSPRFWRHVAAILPDHKLRRKTLRLEGVRYLVL